MRGLRTGVVLLVALITGACTMFGPGDRTTPRTVAPEEEYRIVPEDGLQSTVWGSPPTS